MTMTMETSALIKPYKKPNERFYLLKFLTPVKHCETFKTTIAILFCQKHFK